MTILCSQCHSHMGETDDPARTIDLCRSCQTKWIAEEKRRVHLMARTMDATYQAMSKEERHASE